MNKKPLNVGQTLFGLALMITWLVLIYNDAGLLVLLFWPYIAPTLIAAFWTRKKNWWRIAMVNIFLGLTGVCWILAFIWAAKPDSEDVVKGSPKLQALHDQLRATRDSSIRQALGRASQSGLPEDQNYLNAKVAEYKSEYRALPLAIQEALEAQAAARRQAQAVQTSKREEAGRERIALLQRANELEKQYWETNDASLLQEIKGLRQQASQK